MKKKNTIIVVISVVILIGVILYLLFVSDLFKEKSKMKKPQIDTNTPEINITNKEDAYKFAGKYSDNKSILKLYAFDSGRLFYTIEDEKFYRGAANVVGLLAKAQRKYDNFVDFEFMLKDDGIDFKVLNDSGLDNTHFNKVDDYTPLDFYLDNISEKDYTKTKYNVLFINDNNVLLIYQNGEKTVDIIVSNNTNKLVYSNILEIKSNNKLETKEDIDIKTSLEIKNGSEIVLNIDSEDFNSLNGTFIKDKDITYEDIINKKYLDF